MSYFCMCACCCSLKHWSESCTNDEGDCTIILCVILGILCNAFTCVHIHTSINALKFCLEHGLAYPADITSLYVEGNQPCLGHMTPRHENQCLPVRCVAPQTPQMCKQNAISEQNAMTCHLSVPIHLVPTHARTNTPLRRPHAPADFITRVAACSHYCCLVFDVR